MMLVVYIQGFSERLPETPLPNNSKLLSPETVRC